MTQMDSESIIGSSSTNASSNAATNNTMLDNQSPSLIQQYNWYYDKSELKRTPSVVMDNISPEKERIYRNEGARFILNVGSQMKLRYDTLATGVVYFHRFYMRHSFKVFPNYLTAACCLFLAGKAEETPKKCKDIIKFARVLLNDQQFAAFGEDPREEVLILERIVLQTIRFDLQVDHPYKYILSMAKKLHTKAIKDNSKDKKDLIQEVIQMAWTFTNDSLCTTICLQYEPEIVAIAMIFLASKIRHEINDWEGRLPHQKYWWELFAEDLSLDILEDICHQVLDLYSKPNEQTSGSPPSALPPSNNSPQISNYPAGRMTAEPTTPIKFPSSTTGGNNPAQLPFRPISGLVQSSTNSTTSNIQQQASGQNSTIPPPSALPPSLHAPPIPQHQWDPNLATFYSKYPNFSLVGLTKNPLAPVHMVVPPPPPPPPGIVPPALVALDARLPVVVGQPPPPVAFPPFVSGVNNQHQPT